MRTFLIVIVIATVILLLIKPQNKQLIGGIDNRISDSKLIKAIGTIIEGINISKMKKFLKIFFIIFSLLVILLIYIIYGCWCISIL